MQILVCLKQVPDKDSRYKIDAAGTGIHAPPIFAKVENSHGLLKNSLQQSIVQISQAFDEGFDGKQLFSTYTTRLEQSRRLLQEIASLMEDVRKSEDIADHEVLQPLLRSFEEFRQSSLKYLMFKDWEEFEKFMTATRYFRRIVTTLPRSVHFPVSTWVTG